MMNSTPSSEICLIAALKFFNSVVGYNDLTSLIKKFIINEELTTQSRRNAMRRCLEQFMTLWILSEDSETSVLLARNFSRTADLRIGALTDSLQTLFSELVEKSQNPITVTSCGRLVVWFQFLEALMNEEDSIKEFIKIANNLMLSERIKGFEIRTKKNAKSNDFSDDCGDEIASIDETAFLNDASHI